MWEWVAGSRAKAGWQTLPPAQSAVGRGTDLVSLFLVLQGGQSGARRSRRAHSVWSESRGRGFKLSDKFAVTQAVLAPAVPPLFVHVMRLETCEADSSSTLPLPLLPSPPPPLLPRHVALGESRGKNKTEHTS